MSIGIPQGEKDGINIEFCSGYTDESGAWNPGFYCPNDGDSQAFFCCGTPTYKYCCTYKDLVEEESFKSWYIIIGVVISVSLTMVLTLMICRTCCPSHKKENEHRRSSGDCKMQASSTVNSSTADMYSYSNQPTQNRTSTPQESDTIRTSRAVSQLIMELESHAISNKSFSNMDQQMDSRSDATNLCPPVINEALPTKSVLNIIYSPIPETRSISNCIPELPEDTELYWSTQF